MKKYSDVLITIMTKIIFTCAIIYGLNMLMDKAGMGDMVGINPITVFVGCSLGIPGIALLYAFCWIGQF